MSSMNQPGKFDKTSNNKYLQCPALMEDGRIFTDYRPSTYVNDMIRFGNNIQSSYEYRQFLIHNANNIMTVNSRYTDKKLGCEGTSRVAIPEHTTCFYNTVGSKCQTTNPNGFGMTPAVPPNVAPQLGMSIVPGHICGGFDDAAPLDPKFIPHTYARF